MTKLFFDTEFTGLHQRTTLVSIGIVAETGETFYAELTDYNAEQADDWLVEHVFSKLRLRDHITAAVGGWENYIDEHRHFDNDLEVALADLNMKHYECTGKSAMVKNRLEKWLSQFDQVEMWSDCLAYDWVLFNNLFGTAFDIPKNVYYIPFDICTLFKVKGIDPDISREMFAFGDTVSDVSKHNALWDASVIMACYDKLINGSYQVGHPKHDYTDTDHNK